MNRFCDNCGRAIGRIDSETVEGQTVCLRCAKRLKAEAEAANPTAKVTSTKQMVVAIVVTMVVVGTVLFGIKKLMDVLFE